MKTEPIVTLRLTLTAFAAIRTILRQEAIVAAPKRARFIRQLEQTMFEHSRADRGSAKPKGRK